MRRTLPTTSMVICGLLLAACSATTSTTDQPSAGGEQISSEPANSSGEVGAEEEGEEGRGGEAANEAEEEANLTQERLEAAEQAREAGTFGTAREIVNHPAPGWSGEQLLNHGTDDWEPAVAADPGSPYVYILTTRYGEPKTCPSHCPTPYIPISISADGGKTWKPQVPLCVCRGASGQYDPTIEVVQNTGAVYSAFLNGDRAGAYSTSFIKSTDHGKTWSDPVHVYGHVSWTDKPEITTSPSGRDIYVSWNGPQGGDLYVGMSHDFGNTWTHTKLTNSKRYFFANDGTVLPGGTVVFSESSLTYSGPASSAEGKVWHHAIISRDFGTTWKNVIVDKVALGEDCVAAGCSSDYYTGQTSVANDPTGHLVFTYEGAQVNGGPQRIYVRTSNDGGRTWGSRVALSVKGENATGPRVDSDAAGNARLWYMQTSNGDDPDAWNVWYRSSQDGG
ncbi:MAG: sialidase family protein, partial [Candidatus Nanopelagicales bacterium]